MQNRNRATAKVAILSPIPAALMAAITMAMALTLPAVVHAQQIRNDQTAQAQAGDRACERAAQAAAHDPWLHVKHGDTAPLRADSKIRANMAATAANDGRQVQCWHQLGLAEEMKRP